MTVRRAIVTLALAAIVVAVGLVFVLRDDGSSTARVSGAHEAAAGEPIDVTAGLAPRIVLFGDTLTATVDVTVDRSRVVPGSVRVVQDFVPWGLVRPPARERHDADRATHIRTTYTLRCIISPCVPQRDTASLEFDPVRVTYRENGVKKQQAAEARWPVLVVRSQLVADDFSQPGAASSPWRADTATLPAVSYRFSPGVVRIVALAAGALFAIAGIALGVLAVPRRRKKAPPPEPEPEPEPMLPPLEHALTLLEAEVPANGAADRRKALELVAEAMEERDDRRLARRARGMAWSEDVPVPGETKGLAAEVRALLEEEERVAAELAAVAEERMEDDALAP